MERINYSTGQLNRYLIECYLEVGEKEAAIKLNETKSIGDNKDDMISNLILEMNANNPYASYKIGDKLINEMSIYSEDAECNYYFSKVCYNIILHHRSQISSSELSSETILNNCFKSSIKAIKLNPYRWHFIFNLGNYYKYLIKDYKKALKCYQKVYDICLNLNLCGVELVDCLLKNKEDDEAFIILKRAINEIENCKWASLRLGIIYLKKSEFNEAIRLFHNVIRNDPDDCNVWQCLADAYLNRGSLTSALKSFTKAIEIDADSTYASYQIAHIKQSLKLYDQAVLDYLAVLNKITNHIPTLKGLGETYYLLAVENVKVSLNEKYLEYIELSVKYLCKALLLRKDLCCLWKILADCCGLIRFYPDKSLKM
jgi:tetratricopeptide (TPR) repeat protein